jgi:hypothetical protein
LAVKATTLAGYGIADAYTKEQVNNAINAAVQGKANSATTLAGYGIVDSYTRTQIDGQFTEFAGSVNTALAAKATKANTLAGYGIGDAYTKLQVDSAIGGKQNSLGFTPANASRKIVVGAGLAGGGTLEDDITLSLKLTASIVTDALGFTPISSVTTAAVATATVNMGTGGVGSYGMFNGPTGGPGGTYAGSSLKWADGDNENNGAHPAGTWRKLGFIEDSDDTTLFLRIS